MLRILALLAMLAATTSQAGQSSATAMTTPRNILFVLTSHDRKGDTGQPTGFYLSEATHPHHVLTQAGYQIDFISPKGGKAPIDGFDLNDPINKSFWENPQTRHAVETTKTPDQVRAEDYVAIFFAGGHGAMWDFPDDPRLARLTAAIYERGGVVGAVCHGPAGLLNVKLSGDRYLVAGKKVAAFTNAEEQTVKLEHVVPFLLADKLTARGAHHVPAPDFKPQVIVSERLVTGQNPQSATGVGEAMARLLGTVGALEARRKASPQ